MKTPYPHLPDYLLVAAWFRWRITMGHIVARSFLDKTSEIAEQWDLSEKTIRRGLHVIEQEGLIAKTESGQIFIVEGGHQ